ncbi:hypothetical protein F8M41_010464 [Gigaspora margarita]|uniref:Kinesin motor domain-containing protein n=1 Tax=Gigaspora margarita TaxID=4874 RepID=A0A8H4AUJ2_GIGMA|nr:hypothetical protein F8M41_010464 [Gigaspora margarita]
MNQKSSRSHAIFSVTMIQHKFMPNTGGGSRSMTPEIPELKSGIRSPLRSSSRLSNKRSDDGSSEWTSITTIGNVISALGQKTPSFQYQNRLKCPSTPLSINMALNHSNQNHKDLEALKDQLTQLNGLTRI